MEQTELFSAVVDSYAASQGPMENAQLYQAVATRLQQEGDGTVAPVGRSGARRNLFHRRIRWAQQTLKHRGWLNRVERGSWELAGDRRTQLRAIRQGRQMIAISTRLGVGLWARSEAVFGELLEEPVHLLLTSPPYPLRVARAYGNPPVQEYVDFVCEMLAPVVAKLAEGGSVALNVSNDIFKAGSPARSTYLERLSIALEDRLGLHKMDTLIWSSNKIPGPVQWAHKARIQLATKYEPVLWFCNSPKQCRADNRRVLRPHSERHAALIAAGGEQRQRVSGDGAYRSQAGDYRAATPGAIPGNILTVSNNCGAGRRVNRYARELGLPVHGAKMPLGVADFLVRYLTRPGDLVVDPMAGTLTTGEAAERNGRHWVCVEMMYEYIRQSFVRFDGGDTWINPRFVRGGTGR